MTDQLSKRLRQLENENRVTLIVVTADPNGVMSAAETVFAWDKTNKIMYVNSDGATTWVALN